MINIICNYKYTFDKKLIIRLNETIHNKLIHSKINKNTLQFFKKYFVEYLGMIVESSVTLSSLKETSMDSTTDCFTGDVNKKQKKTG